jgi:hypothetical protein
MSVSGVSSSSFSNLSTESVENTRQEMQQDFEQLGKDLQSGNLSAAQADFATLEQLMPQNNSASAAARTSPIAQAFNQLSEDLQSGNLTAAQQAYANIQQDFQNRTAPTEGHRHHHHHHGDGGAGSFSQLLGQLGQALGSGNLSKAQQVFATLQQDFEQWGQSDGHSQPPQSSSTASSATAS